MFCVHGKPENSDRNPAHSIEGIDVNRSDIKSEAESNAGSRF